MLMELTVIPLERGHSMSSGLAPLIKIIDASGVDYRLTASGTLMEGRWEELLDLVKSCHAEMRKKTERVVTFLKIDDYGDRSGRLIGAVASIENKVGKALKK